MKSKKTLLALIALMIILIYYTTKTEYGQNTSVLLVTGLVFMTSTTVLFSNLILAIKDKARKNYWMQILPMIIITILSTTIFRFWGILICLWLPTAMLFNQLIFAKK